jgi:hypothetical protein
MELISHVIWGPLHVYAKLCDIREFKRIPSTKKKKRKKE